MIPSLAHLSSPFVIVLRLCDELSLNSAGLARTRGLADREAQLQEQVNTLTIQAATAERSLEDSKLALSRKDNQLAEAKAALAAAEAATQSMLGAEFAVRG